MGRIDELKAELIQAVLDSEEYREYKRLEAEVSKNADLKRAIDEFRRRNFEIQYNDEIQGIDENISQLEAQYADMRNQGLAKSYFSAELCLCRLVHDVCVSLVDAVDFDVDFLNESGR